MASNYNQMSEIFRQRDDQYSLKLPSKIGKDEHDDQNFAPQTSRSCPPLLPKVRSSMPSARKLVRSKQKFTEEEIYTELYNAILERRLSPETKLGENLLAEHYGVSRTIIRQVLMRLSHDRLVKLEPNRGAFVATLSPDEAKQIYQAWRLTEAAIVRDVVQIITPEQINILRALIAEERLACEQKDLPKITRLSAQFHMQLAEYCRNQFLSRFLKELVPLTSLAFFYEVPNMPICTKDEHSEILDYIAAKDVEKAVEAVMRHLDGIEAGLNAQALLNSEVSLIDLLKSKVPSLS